MGTANYLNLIERYHEFESAIRELIGSIATGVAEPDIASDQEIQRSTLVSIAHHYPFVDILYVLDADGIQISEYVADRDRHVSHKRDKGRGRDRSQRPYYLAANDQEEVVITQPYLSSADRQLCISASRRVVAPGGQVAYIVLDFDLEQMISFLMGDTARQRFEPFFKGVYVVIATGLLAVVGLLLWSAFTEGLAALSQSSGPSHQLKPFSMIIFLTLGLAIFDLAKTTLEEEVLMTKDVFRHSAVRRTITRFVAAILIAISIEALLLMFKAALGQGENLMQASMMMLGSVGLLIGLGIYVYLGAKAEDLLLARKRRGQ